MQMMNYKLTAACGCNMGKIRKNNEDNFYFNQITLPEENLGMENILYAEYDLTEESGIFGVFDGMGGEADGQIASYLSAGILKEKSELLLSSPMKINKNYEDIIQKMNETVCRDAERRFNRMGCTASILMFAGKKAYLCNVGDSPIFRLRGYSLEQISQDHTDADMLKKQGITNRKPHLTQCIGISPEEMQIQPYLFEEKICIGDRYLICSDGLTDMVKKEEINKTLKEVSDVKECVECLVQKALDGGGRDNITAVVIQVEETSSASNVTHKVQDVPIVKHTGQTQKTAKMQVSEEFKESLRKNDFFEEKEKNNLPVNVQKQDASDKNVSEKSKKLKIGMGIILVLVMILGIGFLGKFLFHKILGKNEITDLQEYEQKYEDIDIEDLTPVDPLDEEKPVDKTETPEESEDLEKSTEETEKSETMEPVEIPIDLNGDGTEDVLTMGILNETGSSIVYLIFKVNESEGILSFSCTYELSAENVKVSESQLIEDSHSIVVQCIDANSSYGNIEYHVITVSMQEEELVVRENLTLNMGLQGDWTEEKVNELNDKLHTLLSGSQD